MNSNKIKLLNKLLNEIKLNIPFKDKKNDSVSNTTVGWQLDHSLKVINGVSTILAKTDPKKYKKDFNLRRSILFTLSYIPRGRGKAPKIVLPPEVITTKDLQAQLKNANTLVNDLDSIHEKAYFNHHVFGTLNKANTLRFLEVHTNHHLKIVRDILKE